MGWRCQQTWGAGKCKAVLPAKKSNNLQGLARGKWRGPWGGKCPEETCSTWWQRQVLPWVQQWWVCKPSLLRLIRALNFSNMRKSMPEFGIPMPRQHLVVLIIWTRCLIMTEYQCAKTLCICWIWIQKTVWGGCQPQPWGNDIILTPCKWTRAPKSEPIRVDNCVRLLPYANGQHINVLKHFVCV